MQVSSAISATLTAEGLFSDGSRQVLTSGLSFASSVPGVAATSGGADDQFRAHSAA